MEHRPKTDPGFGSNDHMNLEAMSIHDLVSVLRIAFRTEQFDTVEEVLVSRYNSLQTEILHLQQKFELEKLIRFQAEEDLRKREELCERGKRAQNNYETLLKEVKKTSLVDRDIIAELRKKNSDLELEVCELRKLKGKWVDDSNALAELRIKVCVLENDKDAIFVVKNSELEKSMQKNSELELEVCELRMLKEKWVDDSNAFSELLNKRSKDAQDASSAIIGELRKKNGELELEVCELRKLKEKWVDDSNALSEPPRKRCKYAQRTSSSVMTQTRGTTVDASHLSHGHPITSLAEHAHVVEERQENDNVHMSDSEEVIVMGKVVIPPSDVQEQMATQNKSKRKIIAIKASPNSFGNFHFASLEHQQLNMSYEWFRIEQNLRVEGNRFSNIQAMIVARGWVELTSFAKVASTALAKEFFANAYKEEYENNKNDLNKFTSFVRGKKVPFHEKIINDLFGLENYDKCSFEERMAKSSCIPNSDICSTLCRPNANWILNHHGMPENLRASDLKPTAKAWAAFVMHSLFPSTSLKLLTIRHATLVTAILKGEPVNVGRLLADDLSGIANCICYSSRMGHPSLISKLCERVGVYHQKNERMVKPCGEINADWIDKH